MTFDKVKLWQTTKKVFTVIWWVILVSGLMLSLAFVRKQENALKCSSVNIHIEPENELQFIDRDRVLHVIRSDGDEKKIPGTPLQSLNILALENRLESDRFIKKAKVFTDMNGSLNIHIDQREPILRILNARGESFYLDRTGVKMPESSLFTARVMVATGNIYEAGEPFDSLQSYIGQELLKIATYVDKDAFWKAQIEQIFVNAASEIVLIPKVGNHTIHFGNTSDMETKFSKLMLFYREALNRLGWEKYSDIDVRYKGQIVCKKNK